MSSASSVVSFRGIFLSPVAMLGMPLGLMGLVLLHMMPRLGSIHVDCAKQN
jgi:hypothetical protein